MPIRTRKAPSVESFGPEIFEALIEGSKREIVLELPYKKAIAFRQRANMLRSAMRAAKHEQYRVVAQTSLRIVWGKDAGYDEVPEKRSTQNVRIPVSRSIPAKLIISPADSEFTEALKKAGVELKPLTPISAPNTDPEPDPGVGDDVLEQFMRGESFNATDK